MSTSEQRSTRELTSLTPRTWARRAAWAAVSAQVGIVVTGALVRLTDSGLGCPTWPRCTPGSYTPVPHPATAHHAYIEFGNRLLTFLVAATALAALVTGVRFARESGRRSLAWLAATGLLGTVAQAVIGGVSVLTGLSPWWVSAHFLVSIVIISLCTLYAVRMSLSPGRSAASAELQHDRWSRLLLPCGVVVTVLGVAVTGSGPHGGDSDVTARLPFPPVIITALHSSAAWLLVIAAITSWRRARREAANSQIHTMYVRLVSLIVAQGLLGYTQSLTGLPIVLVAIHVLIAVLIWTGIVRIYVTQRLTT